MFPLKLVWFFVYRTTMFNWCRIKKCDATTLSPADVRPTSGWRWRCYVRTGYSQADITLDSGTLVVVLWIIIISVIEWYGSYMYVCVIKWIGNFLPTFWGIFVSSNVLCPPAMDNQMKWNVNHVSLYIVDKTMEFANCVIINCLRNAWRKVVNDMWQKH